MCRHTFKMAETCRHLVREHEASVNRTHQFLIYSTFVLVIKLIA